VATKKTNTQKRTDAAKAVATAQKNVKKTMEAIGPLTNPSDYHVSNSYAVVQAATTALLFSLLESMHAPKVIR
jgi:hypothetical protein